jgi:ABC-type branched-subunit amino acid transport system ATPase component/ABC-type branched-subunit amino acid transport system permease subunit
MTAAKQAAPEAPAPVPGAPRPGPMRWVWRGLIVAVTLAMAVFPLLPDTGYYQTIGLLTLLLVIQASGWNIIAGYAGYMSLGQSAFLGIGAYAVAITARETGLEPLLLVLLGGVTAVILACLLSLVTYRARGHAFVIMTIGLLFALETTTRELRAVTGGAPGIQLPLPMWAGTNPQLPFYYAMLLLALLTIALSYAVRRSKLGAGLLAIREDEDKAAAIGIRTPLYKLAGFAASALPIGIAGGIYASYLAYVEPASMFNIVTSVQLVLAGVLGGRGTLWGPPLGALVVEPLNEFTNTAFGNYGNIVGLRHVVFGVLLVAVVVLLPRGVIPTVQQWLERRRDARRERPHTQPPKLRVTEPAPVPAHSDRVLLEVDGLHKRFGGLRVLDDCSFTVREGTITGLIGPNGSGKTTVFNLITGMLKADRGQIRFDGRRIDRLPPWERHTLGVGRTFQITRLFKELSVIDNMVAPLPHFSWRGLATSTTGAELDRARECLELVGMGAMAGERAGTLSFGQQKLVELAQVLMLEPKLILLDEPAGGVNPRLIEQMTELIRECNRRGITFLVVEHNMPMVLGLCDPVVVLARGKALAEGPPAAIRENPAVLDAYLGDGEGTAAPVIPTPTGRSRQSTNRLPAR